MRAHLAPSYSLDCTNSYTQFRAINPNGRIPALTDTFEDGQTIRLFESGSIMLYLIDRYDPEYNMSFPRGTREYYEMNNWLFFQNAGVGPMQGQASKRFLLPKIEDRELLSFCS